VGAGTPATDGFFDGSGGFGGGGAAGGASAMDGPSGGSDGFAGGGGAAGGGAIAGAGGGGAASFGSGGGVTSVGAGGALTMLGGSSGLSVAAVGALAGVFLAIHCSNSPGVTIRRDSGISAGGGSGRFADPVCAQAPANGVRMTMATADDSSFAR